jgi:hypothetical protein
MLTLSHNNIKVIIILTILRINESYIKYEYLGFFVLVQQQLHCFFIIFKPTFT